MAALKKIKVKSIQSTAVGRQYTWLQFWLTLLGALAILTGILWGLPTIISITEDNRRAAIDKNATIIRAIIISRNTHKGRSVKYQYHYAGKTYKGFQQSSDLFDAVEYKTTFDIKLDTLNPEESYIIGY